MANRNKKNPNQTFLALLLVGFACLVQSCQTDEEGPSSIGGFYKYQTAQADRAVDLNNDGVASTNLMTEAQPFDFSFPSAALELTPLHPNDHNTDQVYLFFPHPTHFEAEPNRPIPYRGTSLAYRYTYSPKNSTIGLSLLHPEYPDTEATLGKLNSLSIKSDKHLEANLSKKFYDFRTRNWVMLTITALFEKNH